MMWAASTGVTREPGSNRAVCRCVGSSSTVVIVRVGDATHTGTQGTPSSRSIMPTLTYVDDAYEVARDAHVLVLVTEWNEFRRPDFDAVKAALKEPCIFDGRNIYPKQTLQKMGFFYDGIGR